MITNIHKEMRKERIKTSLIQNVQHRDSDSPSPSHATLAAASTHTSAHRVMTLATCRFTEAKIPFRRPDHTRMYGRAYNAWPVAIVQFPYM